MAFVVGHPTFGGKTQIFKVQFFKLIVVFGSVLKFKMIIYQKYLMYKRKSKYILNHIEFYDFDNFDNFGLRGLVEAATSLGL